MRGQASHSHGAMSSCRERGNIPRTHLPGPGSDLSHRLNTRSGTKPLRSLKNLRIYWWLRHCAKHEIGAKRVYMKLGLWRKDHMGWAGLFSVDSLSQLSVLLDSEMWDFSRGLVHPWLWNFKLREGSFPALLMVSTIHCSHVPTCLLVVVMDGRKWHQEVLHLSSPQSALALSQY